MEFPMKRVLAVIEIARPHNMIAAAACVFSAYYLSAGSLSTDILLPVVFTALVTGLGNTINDYYDRDIDRVNKPRRPIPSERLSPRQALLIYTVGSVVLTTTIFLFLSWPFRSLLVAWELLLFFYAWRGKRLPLVGNMVIGLIAASAFVGGAAVAGDMSVIGFAVLMSFLLVMGRELFKGAEDVDGDRQFGATTIAVRFGVRRAVIAGVLMLCLFALTVPLPAFTGAYGRTYLILMELLVVPGVLAASVIALRSPQRITLNRANWILKFEMFFGIIAITLGRS